MKRKTARRVSAVVMAFLFMVPVAGCFVETADEDEPEGIESTSEAFSTFSCKATTAKGYRNGKPQDISVVRVDGKPVERSAANAYYVMAKAAERAGVQLRVVSGFRTMAEQEYFYSCFKKQNCNDGAIAARPGYSNHQSGHALDLNSKSRGVYAWLQANAAKYGFKRTVPSEDWHWEWWGGGPGGGPCKDDAASSKSSSKDGCFSETLGKDVAENACVQSKSDGKWYQCVGGEWVDRFSEPDACSSVQAL